MALAQQFGNLLHADACRRPVGGSPLSIRSWEIWRFTGCEPRTTIVISPLRSRSASSSNDFAHRAAQEILRETCSLRGPMTISRSPRMRRISASDSLQPVRRLVENHRAAFAAQRLSRLSRSCLFSPAKTLKNKTIGGQTAGAQGRCERRGSGNRRDLNPAASASTTSRYPGSEIAGVPASETSAMFSPRTSRSTKRGAWVFSLCSW